MRMIVHATADAVVDEDWEIEVTPEQAAALKADPGSFEELVAEEGVFVSVTDSVRDEENRLITRVEEKEATK